MSMVLSLGTPVGGVSIAAADYTNIKWTNAGGPDAHGAAYALEAPEFINCEAKHIKSLTIRLSNANSYALDKFEVHGLVHPADTVWVPLALVAADYDGTNDNPFVVLARTYNVTDVYQDADPTTMLANEWMLLKLNVEGFAKVRIRASANATATVLTGWLWGSDEIASSTSLTVSDLEIGAVELKDATAATRAAIATDGAASAKNSLYVQDQNILAVLKDSDAGSLGAGNILGDILAKITASAATSANQTVLTSAPVEKTLVAVSQFVATPTSAENLVVSETFARSVYLQAKRAAADNSGNVFIGLSGLDSGVAEMFELEPGAVFSFEMPAGTKIDLNDVYVDSITADDGVVGWYVPA